MRINITANNGCTLMNNYNIIEDVRTFAGQTATFSFWAKADAAATFDSFFLQQNFGSGGSGSVNTSITLSSTSLTTAWTRYTATIAIPSVSGKTIGTGSNIAILTRQPLSAGVVRNGTYDYWGWQLEAGSVATPFQTLTGSIQGELAACQRYYYRQTAPQVYSTMGTGVNTSTTQCICSVPLPVTMRVPPTSVDFSTLALNDLNGNTVTAVTSVTFDATTGNNGWGSINAAVASGLTIGRSLRLISNNSTSGYLGFSAEL
jgi:hypothetical protein